MRNKETMMQIVDGNVIDLSTGQVVLSKEILNENNMQLIESPENELAVGISYPGKMTVPGDYLKDLDEYKFSNSGIYKQMIVCDKIYKYEGIIGSVVDMLVEMANTPIITQDIKNDEAKKILDFFNRFINKGVQTSTTGLPAFMEQGMTLWLVLGNAFPYSSWRTIDIDGKKVNLPNITYLNPMAIDIDETLTLIGQEKIYLKVEKTTLQSLKQNNVELDIIKNGKSNPYKSGKIPIPSENIAHIKRKARDWEVWGIPYLVRVFSPLSSKKRLRKLDDTTTEGLINYLTIFKIGSSEWQSPYHKVSVARLQAFANLIKNPTASTTLVWPHDIEVITTGPDGKVLDFKDKYAEVDLDILKSLGIVAGMLDKRTSEEAILVLVETLESMRNHFISYLYDLYNTILEKNGLKEPDFKVRFTNIKLADILQKLKSLILSYYDRGLLSYETTLTLGGHEFKQEVARKKAEKKHKQEGLFDIPNLPFSTRKTESPMTTRDDGRPSNKMRTEKTVIDNEVKLTKPNKNIGMNLSRGDAFYIEAFKEGLVQKYTKLMNKILASINKKKRFDENEFSLLLSAGFLELRNYTQKALKIAYDVYNQDMDVDEKDYMYQKLEGWNVFYLSKFREAISSSVKKSVQLVENIDLDLIVPVVVSAFDKEVYRLTHYAEEGFIKARIAGAIETEARDGNIGGYWETAGDDNVCEVCGEKEGNWYTSDQIFDEFPSHVHCRCGIRWTSINPTLENPEINNTIVLTSPSRPNDIL